VAIYVDDLHVGHLSREAAKAFIPIARRLDGRLAACSATIRGGWDRGDGDRGMFGVVLDLGSRESCLAVIDAVTPQAARPQRSRWWHRLGGQ
jgi:hypothetical protein